MLDHLPKHEEKTGGDRIVVLQKDTEKSIDGASKQRRSLEENSSKKTTIHRIRKRQLNFLEMGIRKQGLETLTFSDHIGTREIKESSET